MPYNFRMVRKETAAEAKRNWESFFNSVLKQEWSRALATLDALKKLEPDNPQVYLKAGDILQRTGKPADAVAAYHQTARCLVNEGFNHKALAIYKIIQRIAPDDREAATKTRELLVAIEQERSHSIAAPAAPVPEGARQPQACKAGTEPCPPDEHFSETWASDVLLPAAGKPVEPGVPEAFSELSQAEWEHLSSNALRRSFEDSEPVVLEGEPGDSMFVIMSGRARVSTYMGGKTILLAELREGDLFGEIAFLTGRTRTATVTAAGRLDLLEFRREAMQQLLTDNPALTEKLAQYYARRLDDTLNKIRGR